MTNSIALGLAIVIGIVLAVDAFWLDWSMILFLGRKGLELIEYLAFWR